MNITGPNLNTAGNPAQRTVSEIYHENQAGHFARLNVTECIDAYAPQFQTTNGNLILVSNLTNASPVLGIYYSDLLSSVPELERGDLPDPSWWICGSKDTRAPRQLTEEANPEPLNIRGPCRLRKLDNVRKNALDWRPFGERVDYCLTQPTVLHCKVYGSYSLAFLIAIMTLVHVIAMIVMFCCIKLQPLLTLGDAIASFLEDPDDHTKNMCLTSNEDFRTWGLTKTKWVLCEKQWVSKTRRWYAVARVRRWTICWAL